MTAQVVPFPHQRITPPRGKKPHRAKVFCLHHRYRKVEIYSALAGLWLFACRDCGHLLSWDRECGWREGMETEDEPFEILEEQNIKDY